MLTLPPTIHSLPNPLPLLPPQNCPSGFYKYWSASNVVSICYHIGTVKRDWFAAKEACERLGSATSSSRCFVSLASVMNGNENDFIAAVMGQWGEGGGGGYLPSTVSDLCPRQPGNVDTNPLTEMVLCCSSPATLARSLEKV